MPGSLHWMLKTCPLPSPSLCTPSLQKPLHDWGNLDCTAGRLQTARGVAKILACYESPSTLCWGLKVGGLPITARVPRVPLPCQNKAPVTNDLHATLLAHPVTMHTRSLHRVAPGGPAPGLLTQAGRR